MLTPAKGGKKKPKEAPPTEASSKEAPPVEAVKESAEPVVK
jgi:hypothetical protein